MLTISTFLEKKKSSHYIRLAFPKKCLIICKRSIIHGGSQAVLGMAAYLAKLIGPHIEEGVLSVPIGSSSSGTYTQFLW